MPADHEKPTELGACEGKEFGALGSKVQICERLQEGIGCKIWQASNVLLEWLPHEVPDFSDFSFVDIGAATGYVAIALASHGSRVVAMDYDKVAVKNMKRNIHLNGVASRCKSMRWDWTTPLPDDAATSTYDLLIASDILYGRFCAKHSRQIAAGIRKVLEQVRERRGYMVNLVRTCAHTVEAFPIVCAAEGVRAEVVLATDLPKEFVQGLRVYEGRDDDSTTPQDLLWTSYRLIKLSLLPQGCDPHAAAQLDLLEQEEASDPEDPLEGWDLPPGDSDDE